MKVSNTVVRLSPLIAVLALVAADTGLLWQGGDDPYSFTTLRGQTAEIYGQGLYPFLAGVLILRRNPLGYLIAFSLLVLETTLAPLIATQTVSQVLAGVSFTTGEIVGPMAGFVVLATVAIWVMVTILRNISDSAPPRTARVR